MTFSVCVFCGSRFGGDPAYEAEARALGEGLARRGWRLVYGGGDVGLMGTVANAALRAGGEVLGIIPRRLFEREVGKREVDDLIVTTSMAERKERMIADSHAFVTLAGGLGTLDEVLEVMTLRQLGFIDKPILLIDTQGYWQPFVALMDQVVEAGFADPGTQRLVTVAGNAEEALGLLAQEAGQPG